MHSQKPVKPVWACDRKYCIMSPYNCIFLGVVQNAADLLIGGTVCRQTDHNQGFVFSGTQTHRHEKSCAPRNTSSAKKWAAHLHEASGAFHRVSHLLQRFEISKRPRSAIFATWDAKWNIANRYYNAVVSSRGVHKKLLYFNAIRRPESLYFNDIRLLVVIENRSHMSRHICMQLTDCLSSTPAEGHP